MDILKLTLIFFGTLLLFAGLFALACEMTVWRAQRAMDERYNGFARSLLAQQAIQGTNRARAVDGRPLLPEPVLTWD